MDEERLGDLQAKEIKLLEAAYYSSPGDAFAHFAMREFFDLEDEDAYEFAAVGGTNDKGIDGFWNDPNERRLLLVQAKYAESPRLFDRSVVLEAVGAYRWLDKLSRDPRLGIRDEVLAAARQVAEMREVERDYPVHIFCIVNGTYSPAAIEEAERASEELDREGVKLFLVNRSELLARVEDRRSRTAEGDRPSASLTLTEYFEFSQGPRALVANIAGVELAELVKQYHYRIFERNVRYYLRATQKVNKDIARTLRKNPDSFWYYNNGIAIVCDTFSVEGNRVKLRNMQIVNGCQTTTTLGELVDELAQSDVQVLARIIETTDEEFQRNITLYNNRQNAVRDRDLLSNDVLQDRLQSEFDQLDPPWFYERKRGEWDAVVAKNPAVKARYGKQAARRIDNEKAAQAAYAFYFNPGRARIDKKQLFLRKQDGGVYEDIFNEDTNTTWLLVPFLVQEYVSVRKRQHQREVKNIEEGKADAKQRRLLAKEWVRFSDQLFTATIGFYLEKVTSWRVERFEQLLQADLDDILQKLYALATRDLQVLFARKGQEAKGRGEPFLSANYVKGNWREVQEHLATEWDAHEDMGEDRLISVPIPPPLAG